MAQAPETVSKTAVPGLPRRPRGRLAPKDYIDGILNGDRVALARAITVIESDLPSDAALAREILEAVITRTGHSRRIGITGVPGAGKSTFIDALGTYLISERGENLAVLSVDPSSPISQGSILGDKTRMERLAQQEAAFIRPSPSRNHLGGVARHTRETILLCEAAGFKNVFVETVGVGQSETAVRSMTDFFLLIMIAGAGDELQGIKRGIIEMTDLMAINKADGDNKARAERARVEYASALHLFPPTPEGWTPPVLTCSAVTGEGLPAIWDAVLGHRELLETNGWLARRRQQQSLAWMHELIASGLQEQFRKHPEVRDHLPRVETDVRNGRMTSFGAAQSLLALFRAKE